MKIAYRTNIDVIALLKNDISEEELNAFRKRRLAYKKAIRPYIIPENGIIKGDTLKDIYFPVPQKDGQAYDIFISHSHKDETKAVLLAAWIEKFNPSLTCFVDSFVWRSADQLLKEIDDKYCWIKHSKTYSYQKRNFTTSHVHAILAMSLLDMIVASKYCIFIESSESISLSNSLTKKTLSPWLYEEIKYMKLLQPKSEVRLFSEGMEKVFRCEYDVPTLNSFPFLDKANLWHLDANVLFD